MLPLCFKKLKPEVDTAEVTFHMDFLEMSVIMAVACGPFSRARFPKYECMSSVRAQGPRTVLLCRGQNHYCVTCIFSRLIKPNHHSIVISAPTSYSVDSDLKSLPNYRLS
jgi:hypothetical protein